MLKGHASWPMEGTHSSSKSSHKKDRKIYGDEETGRKKGGKIPMRSPKVTLSRKGIALYPSKYNKKKKKPKLEEKMFGWGGLDDANVTISATVVLRYMFSLAEMRADENLRSELEADVQEECVELGPVDQSRFARIIHRVMFW
ncbi:hypothetical protein Patl1_27167 [Pistacia atlantica]|uniref:Uncharacterized protein n=1 Tax=Pistacia atlantica TaxID=434234 RepID=A0ACC1B3M1_9ROSI|nr:hypothetical protein Patl1_27167 [Pistacia atlantica]